MAENYNLKYTGAEIDNILDKANAATDVIVDSALSTTSTNPVQNKVVANKVNSISSSVSTLSSSNSTLSTRVNNLESSNSTLTSKVSTLETKVSALSSAETATIKVGSLSGSSSSVDLGSNVKAVLVMSSAFLEEYATNDPEYNDPYGMTKLLFPGDTGSNETIYIYNYSWTATSSPYNRYRRQSVSLSSAGVLSHKISTNSSLSASTRYVAFY